MREKLDLLKDLGAEALVDLLRLDHLLHAAWKRADRLRGRPCASEGSGEGSGVYWMLGYWENAFFLAVITRLQFTVVIFFFTEQPRDAAPFQ